MDHLNNIDVEQIRALAEAHDLPLHLVHTGRVGENLASFRDVAQRLYPKTQVCLAAKSNPCRGALRLAARLGLGLDAVSEFELQAGLEEGIDPNLIVCNGNAKSDAYIDLAVKSGALIALDSDWEMDLVAHAAARHGKPTRTLLRFVGMPLEGLTAADQSTAAAWTKFGFPFDDSDRVIELARRTPNIDIAGVSAHIGTQICDENGYDRLVDHLLILMQKMSKAGLNLRYIDVGGGFPVSYLTESEWKSFQARLCDQLAGKLPVTEWVTWDNHPMGFADHSKSDVRDIDRRGGLSYWQGKAYWSAYPGAKMLEHLLMRRLTGTEACPTVTGTEACPTEGCETVAERLKRLGEPTLIIEPGRALFGTAGITVAKVAGVKKVLGNHVVALEMGVVNHGHALVTLDIHPVEVIPPRDSDEPVEAFLAGQLCFTGDMISKVKVKLNRLPKRGELLVIHHTGAYSADHFASNSCGFPRPAKVAVSENGSVEVWRRRDRFGDVFGDLL